MNELAFVVQIHVQFACLVTREVFGGGGGITPYMGWVRKYR